MRIKTYNAIFNEQIYKEYKKAKNKDEYITSFTQTDDSNQYGINSKLDFYNLLLSECVIQQDVELFTEILSQVDKQDYPSLLISVNEKQMSPISYALLLNEAEQIREVIKDSLNHGTKFQKVTLPEQALRTLYEIIGYQGESYLDCIDEFIKPICEDSVVQILAEPCKELVDFSSS